MTTRFSQLLMASLFSCACAGQTVRQLDPRDTSLPLETRQWIADAEDGVIAARAERAAEQAKLAELRRWRQQVLSNAGWGPAVASALEGLAQARVALAELHVEWAESRVAFAVAKYRAANAERAVLHDLAQYELEPLRRAVDQAKQAMSEQRAKATKQQAQLETVTQKFWDAYAQHVKSGGSTDAFWTGGAAPIQITDDANADASEQVAERPKR
jgi:hypothetical protein